MQIICVRTQLYACARKCQGTIKLMLDGFTKQEMSAWGGLLDAYSKVNRLVEEDLQTHFHFSHVEFEALLRLYWIEGNRLRIQDLAAQSILSPSGMSRAIERLEKAGFVKREEASEDRRGAYAVMTPETVVHMKTIIEHHVAFVREIFLSRFTKRELDVMSDFWSRINNTPPKR